MRYAMQEERRRDEGTGDSTVCMYTHTHITCVIYIYIHTYIY
jgi:hypothetical protein